MHVTVICRSTTIVNREPVSSLDLWVEGRKIRCWQCFDNKEWSFTIGGFKYKDPAIAAMFIDGGCVPDYETWELMKDAIRPLFQDQALVEDQLILQSTQTLDPFSRC